eukprot:3168933-Pleurochrysis_carterae.AAC.5
MSSDRNEIKGLHERHFQRSPKRCFTPIGQSNFVILLVPSRPFPLHFVKYDRTCKVSAARGRSGEHGLASISIPRVASSCVL